MALDRDLCWQLPLLGVCLNDQEEESGVSVKTDGDGKSHKRESQLVRLSGWAINSR